ncbi:substrate-binding periplasmic protein [Rheinheimera hassiensis]|uniref:substrate-binding periplasmic protein n=1 Tax=Rheinheimera hassiensis TaxID=1193627 RepID=UPI001F065D63|nr:transporter substrate-binding domain-containing protein [Rheinheimera hassiensis]
MKFGQYLIAVSMLLPVHVTQAAQPLRFGLHLSAPWSFYNEQGEPDGFEYRLVSRIFNDAGYKVEYEFYSYNRLLKQFADKKLDCASPVAITYPGASYTQPYLPFQDVAISRKEANLTIDTLQDLSDKRIAAYQQARQVLGADFQHAVSTAGYLELAERELQLELLFSNRVDVVVGERRVLLHLAAKLAPHISLSIYPLFDAHDYPAACWQLEHVTLFNRGLQQLAQSGELAKMLQWHDPVVAVGTK